MNKFYHLAPKITAGPGGIHCPCCNGLHKGRSQKMTKSHINRIVRRAVKKELVSKAIDVSSTEEI